MLVRDHAIELPVYLSIWHSVADSFFFQAEDGIRDLVRSRGLGDVYKRQQQPGLAWTSHKRHPLQRRVRVFGLAFQRAERSENLSLIHI